MKKLETVRRAICSKQKLIQNKQSHAGSPAQSGNHEAQICRLHCKTKETASDIINRIEEQNPGRCVNQELQECLDGFGEEFHHADSWISLP